MTPSEVDDGRCCYCDRDFGSLVLWRGREVVLRRERDHLIPKATERIGVNFSRNVVPACHLCNQIKGSLSFGSFAAAKLYVVDELRLQPGGHSVARSTDAAHECVQTHPCANPGCGRAARRKRSWGRYCSDLCRLRSWESKHPRQRPLAFEPELAPLPLAYRGETYIPSLDGARLGRQLALVAACMASGSWMTLREIESVTGQPQASVSARLRELRHRGATVERRRRGNVKAGLHEYRVS